MLHPALRRGLLNVWATVTLALACWVIVALVAAAVQRSHHQDDAAQAAAATHFYRVIGGKTQPGSSVSDTLALDLRNLDPAQLRFFRGTSNQYGGITDEIGVKVFDGSCGTECGSLTPQTLARVRAARAGADVTVSSHSHTVSASLPATLLMLWIALGIAGAFLLGLSPILRSRRHARRLRREYGPETRLVQELSEALDELPKGHPSYSRVVALRNNLQGAIEHRVDAGESELVNQRLKGLVREAETTLEAYSTGNRTLEDNT